MELKSLNSTPERWFDVPGTDIEVLLRMPTRDELMRAYKQCVKTSRKGKEELDAKKWRQVVATSFLRDVKGLTDDGNPVEYTPEIGMALMNNLTIGPHVDGLLTDGAEWIELGNA